MPLVKLYVGRDSLDAHHIRSLLTDAGVHAVVLGDSLAIGRGELPFTMQTQPAVWVNDADAERALAIINRRAGEDRTDGAPPMEWTCGSCGETVEPQFAICWSCGASRDGAPDAEFQPAVQFHPVCTACGHLLVGTQSAECPECGGPIDRTRRDTPLDLPGHGD